VEVVSNAPSWQFADVVCGEAHAVLWEALLLLVCSRCVPLGQDCVAARCAFTTFLTFDV
jgi:hypothetical protein